MMKKFGSFKRSPSEGSNTPKKDNGFGLKFRSSQPTIQETFTCPEEGVTKNMENLTQSFEMMSTGSEDTESTTGSSSSGCSKNDSNKVVKEGWLQKRGEHIKNWRPRYFVLRADGRLQGFKRPNQTDSEPLNNFTVKGCQIITVDKPKPFTFIIRGLHEKSAVERTFHVKTAKERHEWVDAIKSVALGIHSGGSRDSLATRLCSASSCSDSLGTRSHLSTYNEANLDANVKEDIQKLLKSLESKNGFNELTAKFNVRGVSKSSTGRSKVTLENFEFLKVLGRGTYGKVILCREKESSEFYAVKVLKKDAIIRNNEVAHTVTESRVLRYCKHPFLVGLKCIFQTEFNICYVLEYANGGELFSHLKKARFFTESRSKFYAAQIIEALGYLHTLGIIYRDLKLENILLDVEGHVKIADFGLCKEDLGYGNTTRTFCGTPEYLAPEIIEDRDYGVAVDWWTLGIVMYEMMTGRLPFGGANHQELFMEILRREVRFPHALSFEAQDIVLKLLSKDPHERLGGGPHDVMDIKDHLFFRSINWLDLYHKRIPPPFKPDVESATDTKYFDDMFTGEDVALTPPENTNFGDDLDDIVEEEDDFLETVTFLD